MMMMRKFCKTLFNISRHSSDVCGGKSFGNRKSTEKFNEEGKYMVVGVTGY